MCLSLDAAFFSPFSMERFCPLLFASQYAQLAYFLYHFEKQPHCRVQKIDVQLDSLSLTLSSKGGLSRQWLEEIFSKKKLAGSIAVKEIALVSWKAWARENGLSFLEPIAGRNFFEPALSPSDQIEQFISSVEKDGFAAKSARDRSNKMSVALPKNSLLSCLEIVIEQSYFLIPISESFAFALDKQLEQNRSKILPITGADRQLQFSSIDESLTNSSASKGKRSSYRSSAQSGLKVQLSQLKLTLKKQSKEPLLPCYLEDSESPSDSMSLLFAPFKASFAPEDRKDPFLKECYLARSYGAVSLQKKKEKEQLQSAIADVFSSSSKREEMSISSSSLERCMRDFLGKQGGFDALDGRPVFFDVVSSGSLIDGAFLTTFDLEKGKYSNKQILESWILPGALQVGKILELNQIYLTSAEGQCIQLDSDKAIEGSVSAEYGSDGALQQVCFIGRKQKRLLPFCQAYFFFEENKECARVVLLFGNLDVFNR